MCFSTTSSSTNNSQNTLSTWDENASKDVANKAQKAINTPYQGYTGPTEGAFGSTFGTAENAATARSGATDPNYTAGTSSLAQGLGLAGTTASTPVSSLMSSYTGAALTPTLDAIQRQAATDNKGLATNATMAGAFGDTGFGTQKATNDYNTTQAISGATGTAYDKAYQTALGTQQTALSQLFGGVGQATGLGTATNNTATNLEALLGSLGLSKEQANQTGINTAINVNNQNQLGDLEKLQMAGGALGSTPHDSYTASQGSQTQPDNSGMGLLGTLLAAPASSLFGTGLSNLFGGSSSYGGVNYGSPDIAAAAKAGVDSGLQRDPSTGDVW